MEKVRTKRLYFNASSVLNRIHCRDCPSFLSYRATQFEPPEQVCLDGDFANDHLCDEALGVLEQLIDDGELSNDSGYVAYNTYCADNEEFEPKEGWDAHAWWWVFFDGNDPIGMDALEEVFRECFS